MMTPKSYLFLFVLIIILTFIIGVRYGKKVEKSNKIIDYLLTLTPAASPTPPPSPTPIKYATSEGKIWRIKFIYPENFKIEENATKGSVIIKPKDNLK